MKWRWRKQNGRELDPEEIFLDSSNLPRFDVNQFEGRIEQPIKKSAFYILGGAAFLAALVFIGRLAELQIIRGTALAARSASNILRQIPIFAERGIITDRNAVELAWNDQKGRVYIDKPGFGHLLGYISYPNEKELAGEKFYPEELVGRDGVEKLFNDRLQGESGIKIEEHNAKGEIESDHVLKPPLPGHDLVLAIDGRVQEPLNRAINELVAEGRFVAGAGVIMDVHTGELVALSSVPEYDPNVLARGDDVAKINSYLTDSRQLFLNRAVAGVYTPGSIVKPIMALAALSEGIINPEKKILSTGALVLPNPFFPDQPTVFKDWKAHGWVDLRQALAASSNVYFYTVGGGFGDQAGLGIANIAKYAEKFGLGRPTGIEFSNEESGLVPTPAWKAKTFDGEAWRLGDTYHTAIGQYGFQVTAVQMARAVAALATGGKLVRPTVLAKKDVEPVAAEMIEGIKPEHFQIVREGMRLSVTNGIAAGLNAPYVEVAAKTGTAELGLTREEVNSWVTGFFPYQAPQYAFAVVLERAKRNNQVGAIFAMRQALDVIHQTAPEYFD
ncbi:MAG: hypothetical protein HYT48_01235 [Candidatus Vogelbacteria bacterium]|nr:hypothetical protein [Candidatus Vogelbacteria bacterium]